MSASVVSTDAQGNAVAALTTFQPATVTATVGVGSTTGGTGTGTTGGSGSTTTSNNQASVTVTLNASPGRLLSVMSIVASVPRGETPAEPKSPPAPLP